MGFNAIQDIASEIRRVVVAGAYDSRFERRDERIGVNRARLRNVRTHLPDKPGRI
jgi:hypothetical protein